MSRTPVQVGKANRNAGIAWERACAVRARDWFPGAGRAIERTGYASQGDLTGIPRVHVECTTTTWDKIFVKLDQAARHAAANGVGGVPVVWKRRNRFRDPGDGVVLLTAARFLSLVARLDKMDQVEMAAGDAYDRGYAAGQRAKADAS